MFLMIPSVSLAAYALSIGLSPTAICSIVMFNLLVFGVLGGVAAYVLNTLPRAYSRVDRIPPQPAAARTVRRQAPLTVRRQAPLTERRRAS